MAGGPLERGGMLHQQEAPVSYGVQHSEQLPSPGPSAKLGTSDPPRFHLVRVLVMVEFLGSLGKRYWPKYPSTFRPKRGCWSGSESASAGS